MPSVQQQRDKLIGLLKQLFQLDQPDLDFGFYKIMHAKSEQVQRFLENDLLDIIKKEFGELDGDRIAVAKAKYEAALKTAKDYGAATPEEAPAVKEAKAEYENAKEGGSPEGDIYDHLWRFFERYYDNGDFLSRRYYARETAGKAAPYAIPYDGREVYLHWANKDQYYIKTSEYLSNFTFNPAKSEEYKKLAGELLPKNEQGLENLKVHCRIVEASEGEHGNVKTSEGQQRFFIIHGEQPIKLENGELIIQFQYRTDPEKTGQDNTWKQKRLAEAVETIIAALKQSPEAKVFLDVLTLPAPTKDQTLLAKYFNQYTARNTMDYFIHKDLGGFLNRELDFYIKNEIMRLDDIENSEAPKVETYLKKIRVLRKIARQLIEFLAQLENFQNKLFLKKKFVIETNYCITLDRIFAIGMDEENSSRKTQLEIVRDELLKQIIVNKGQTEEWASLFSIDEIFSSGSAFSNPLTIEFLKNNDKLVLDTYFFNEKFKQKLLSVIENLDEECDGLLVHSENFQALNLFRERHRKEVKCVYIDPPYNTGKDGFIYKDVYRTSSWCSSINGGLNALFPILTDDSLLFISNDDNENENLKKILKDNGYIVKTNLIWNTEGHTDNQFEIKINHEYITLSQKSQRADYGNVIDPNTRSESNLWKNVAENSITKNGPANPFSDVVLPIGFPVKAESGIIHKEIPEEAFFAELKSQPFYPRKLINKYGVSFPIKYNSAKYKDFKLCEELKVSAGWANLNKLKKFIDNGCTPFSDDDGMMEFYLTAKGTIYYKKTKDAARNIVSVLRNFTTTEKMKYELEDMGIDFSYPKPKDLISYLLKIGNASIYLDYFAGSGTTAHSIISLNREDNGKRKYILVEMGSYFDTVLKPRITKIIYSENWKDGKPTALHTGISHCFKYLRLESYEDALNNLTFSEDTKRKIANADNDALRQDYMLKYWLDMETRSSPSLLNIEQFTDPSTYTLKIKKPGTDEYEDKNVDLIETFNWLIGLHVEHMDMWRCYDVSFKREQDPELPGDSNTKLVIDGKLKETDAGKFAFRKIEGWVCKTPGNTEDREKVLVVWRKLTGNLEEDNAVLDEWFRKLDIRSRDTEFDVIYVNGSNNLPNLRREDEHWKVRLLEETFHQKMWDIEDV